MNSQSNRLNRSACLLIVLFLAGCQSLDQFNLSDSMSVKKLKQGSVSANGLFTNEFFEFEFQTPPGWKSTVSDPPAVLLCRPTSKQISESSMRKFTDIQLMTREITDSEKIVDVMAAYATNHQFELILERSFSIPGADSRLGIFYGDEKGDAIKLMTLFAIFDGKLVILQCRALKSHFDKIESAFTQALDSFRILSQPIITPTPTPTPDPSDPQNDTFIYIIKIGDTGSAIAERFMGDEGRAWIIIKMNELTELKPNQRISIPRYLTYRIQPEDTYERIANKWLGNSRYGTRIQEYNKSTMLSEGQTLYIPLYLNEEPQPGEGYVNLSQRKFKSGEYVDQLMTYNDGKPLDSIGQVKIPIFLLENVYKYTVQSGDTLAGIAAWLTRNKDNYKEIASVNGLTAPYNLTAGQVLKIPGHLVSDPDVFNKPRPKMPPTPVPPPAPAPKLPQPKEAKKDIPKEPPIPPAFSAATPTPLSIPIDKDGLYDID